MEDAKNMKPADLIHPTPDPATNQILGYGRIITILVGLNEDGTEQFKQYHLTPVSLKDIPTLMSLVGGFVDGFSKDGEEFSKESLESIAKCIVMSAKRIHKDITEDEVLENFSLGSLAESIEIILDMNDFLSRMTAVNQKMMTTKK